AGADCGRRRPAGRRPRLRGGVVVVRQGRGAPRHDRSARDRHSRGRADVAWGAPMSRSRVVTFIVVCGLALALAVGTVLRGTQQAKSQRRPTAASAQDQLLDFGTVRSAPHIVFRSTAFGPTYGRLAVVPLHKPGGPRAVGPMSCERVYATRERGVCLTNSGGVVPTFHAVVLDAGLSPVRKVSLSGGPSRARLSPGSDLFAVTVFVAGHSYTDGGFSTL